jgi:hypothetical protein
MHGPLNIKIDFIVWLLAYLSNLNLFYNPIHVYVPPLPDLCKGSLPQAFR